MSTLFGMPFFLEDQSGDIENSEFNDLYNRMRFSLRKTSADDAANTTLMVYDLSSPSASSRNDLRVPVACLTFGAGPTLGTVRIKTGPAVNMEQYLSRVGRK